MSDMETLSLHCMPRCVQRRLWASCSQQGLSEAAKYAAGTVLCCVDEAQKIPPALEREAELVLLRVTEAWQKLVSLPPGAAPSVPALTACKLSSTDCCLHASVGSNALHPRSCIVNSPLRVMRQ